MENQYARWRIDTDQFEHWTVHMYSTTQNGCPGRMYVTYKKPLEAPLTAAPIAAQVELTFLVRPIIEEVLYALYRNRSIRVNWEELRNSFRQLHLHAVPRHDEPVIFFGHKEVDPNPTGRLPMIAANDSWSDPEKLSLRTKLSALLQQHCEKLEEMRITMRQELAQYLAQQTILP